MIRVLKLHPEAFVPKTWSEQAVGLDLHACLTTDRGGRNNAMLPTGATKPISTGIAIEVTRGFFAMVCSRSGLAKRSIWITNAPGIIDPDYRGEVICLLYNGSHETQWIKHGDRIAQLVLVPYTCPLPVEEVAALSESGRASTGFGSTGT